MGAVQRVRVSRFFQRLEFALVCPLGGAIKPVAELFGHFAVQGPVHDLGIQNVGGEELPVQPQVHLLGTDVWAGGGRQEKTGEEDGRSRGKGWGS